MKVFPAVLVLTGMGLMDIIVAGQGHNMRAKVHGKRKLQLKLSDFDRVAIRQAHFLKDTAKLPIQVISPNQTTVAANGIEYSLDGLSKYSVRAPGMKFIVDGDEVSISEPSTLWKGTDPSGATIFVVKDAITGAPTFVNINVGSNETSLVVLDAGKGYGPDAMVEITSGDYDNDLLRSMWHFGDEEQREEEDDGVEKGDDHHRKLQTCSSFDVIEVAILFDSSFCTQLGGSYDTARNLVESIIGKASSRYEVSGLCVKLTLSYLEGYCDPQEDPYFDVVQNSQELDLLDIFRDHWNEYRADLATYPRDIAHFFIGTDYSPDDAVGVAFGGTVCDQVDAYAVDWITHTEDLLLQSNLFAHELGHNCGAPHYGNENTGHIMNPKLNDAPNGFSESSIGAMRNYLGAQSCLASVDVGGGGGGEGEGLLGDWDFCTISSECQNGCCSNEYSDDGKLKCTLLNGGFDPNICVSHSGGGEGNGGEFVSYRTPVPGLSLNWYCLDLTFGDTSNFTPIQLWECNQSNPQKWLLDSEGYIRSAMDTNKCIVPANGDSASTDSGTPLVLYDCVANVPEMQWVQYSDQTIRPLTASSQCMDMPNWEAYNGAPLMLYDCNGGLNQQWLEE